MSEEKKNRTVLRALQILELLKSEERPMTCKEICQALSIPTSSTFDILRTLHSEGFVEFSDRRDKSYVIGAKTFEIGISYLKNASTYSIVEPYVLRLMELSQATAFFALEHNAQIIYVNKVEALTSVHTSAALGARRDMHSTGLGKAILACYSDEKIKSLYSGRSLPSYTEFTITSVDKLLEDAAQTRKRGYSIDNREGDRNIFCVACAVRDYTQRALGAISVAMMYGQKSPDEIEVLGNTVSSYAHEISNKLGYLGETYSNLYK